MAKVQTTGFSRVFLVEGRAAPNHAPEYQGFWKAGGLSWDQGDITSIRVPSPDNYDQFVVVDKIAGEQGDPELTIMARFDTNTSRLLKLARKSCDNDLQIHFGRCGKPNDFNGGWEKIGVLEAARPTTYGTDDLGAMDTSERAVINEEVPFTGEDYYEIKKIILAEQARVQIVQEVVDIYVCDSPSCGSDCVSESDGCSTVFAVTLSAGGSPGLPAEVIYTQDGGATWGETNVSSLAAAENPNAIACVGSSLIVVSNDSVSLHHALLSEILNGTETWAEVTTGFDAGGPPNAIFNAGPSFSWIVGNGGYIYFTDDPLSLVEIQDAGVATAENLNAVHGYDSENIVAVGANNAVVYTRNGGSTWGSVTGPAAGVALNAVFVRREDEWWVGAANGRMYYTVNAGTTWTEKSFPGAGTGEVRDIVFSTRSVGWMSHDTVTPAGRILRTIDGGFSWYVAPETTGNIPANDRINALAVCHDANVIYGAGLADNGTDGFVVKGA